MSNTCNQCGSFEGRCEILSGQGLGNCKWKKMASDGLLNRIEGEEELREVSKLLRQAYELGRRSW